MKKKGLGRKPFDFTQGHEALEWLAQMDANLKAKIEIMIIVKKVKMFFKSFDLNSRKSALICGSFLVWAGWILSAPVLGAEGDAKAALANGDQAFQAKNYAAALQLYQQAAQEGNVSAENNLGYLYDHGLGTAQDYGQAVKHYRVAAEAGNAAAQNNLGRLYNKGLGVGKDTQESFRWHSKAALQGDPEGEYWVGYDYALGHGVKGDMSKAADWMKQSAKAGYAPAQDGLAMLYKEGLGVKQDAAQSKEWNQKAEAQKASEAQAAKDAKAAYTYIVTAGDTLWTIARKLLAQGHLWNSIFQVNKDHIHDPAVIYPGEVLTIQKTGT